MAAARAKPNLTRQRTAAAVAAAPSRPAADSVVLRLPVPPSSNAVWAVKAGGKGLRLSDTYARWLVDAGWRVQQQRPGKISGGYALALYLPASSRMDLDNSIAGISDLLQLQGVIDNDRDAEATDLRWHGTSDEVVVALRPFDSTIRSKRMLPDDLQVPA